MPIISPTVSDPHHDIALVVSVFNEEITKNLWQAAHQTLLDAGYSEEQIYTVWVPGAVEIPLMTKILLSSGRFAGAIGLGAVIRGDTDHYNYVCQQVSYGCQKVSLMSGYPVMFGVLTTENEEQAYARSAANENNKGAEAAHALLSFLSVIEQTEAL